MRLALVALALGTLVGVINHVAVIAGFLDPPPGFEPALFIRNLDVPQYLTWGALARDHWLLPNYHAPWRTEPALFQPMLQFVGKSGLPPVLAHYGLQFLLYWVTAWVLLLAAKTFCQTRRQVVYASIAMVSALPLKLIGWAVAKWVGAALPVQLGLAYGLIEYSYETADGFLRGGLSNSFTLTFGTAVTVGSFTLLAQYCRTGTRKYLFGLCILAFFGALLHPFEVFLVAFGAIFPLLRMKRPFEILLVGGAGALGLVPYLVQSVRSGWVRDASDIAQWQMTSPVWVMLTYGLPVILICWLMAMRFRGPDPEDDVLQSWFLSTALLPMVPAIPVAIHLFDGFTYCVGFLLVRKVAQDKLFQRYGDRLRPLAWAGAALSLAVLFTSYFQIYTDGKSADPMIGRPAVVARDERAMLDWMRLHLVRDRLVLAPEEMAPWVAALPQVAMASHDVFSIGFDEQREAIKRFRAGDMSVIDTYGVSYVVSEQRLAAGNLLQSEGRYALYEFPGRVMKPYTRPTSPRRNAFRQWVFALFGADQK
ncbi:MAG: hypothetical protein JNM66_32330 [Bryobacterales bacterium]|nr:hypothetical protein [Bryobacterales bacterium]